MWSRAVSRSFAPLLLTVIAGCSTDPSGPGGGDNGGPPPNSVDAVVEIRAFDSPLRFDSPVHANRDEALTEITIPVIVRWINAGGLAHSVTPVGHAEFSEGVGMHRGQVILVHTFTKTGRFEYICKFHGDLGMRGTVVVF